MKIPDNGSLPEAENHEHAAQRTRRERGRGRVFIIAAFFVLLGVYTVIRSLDGGTDFTIQYNAASAMIGGENPFTDRINNRYPVFLFVLISPLTLVPLPAAVAIWYAISVAAFLGSVVLLKRLFETRRVARTPNWIRLTVALSFGFLIDNLYLGQTNLVILVLVLLTLVLHESGRDTMAGVPLGGAIALKLTPLLLLAYFSWRLRTRLVGVALLTTLVAILVAPIPVLGFERHVEIVGSFYEEVLAASASGDLGGENVYRHTNQSLASAFFRFLTETPADTRGGADVFVNVMDLDKGAASAAVRVIDLAIVGLLVFSCRRPRSRHPELERAFQYSLILIAMLLISPISWISHFILLIVPFAAVSWYALEHGGPYRRAALVCLAITFGGAALGLAVELQSYSPLFFGTLVLLSFCVTVLLRSEVAFQTRGDI